MNLIIIRHGETKEAKKGVLLGNLPGHLTAKGKKEMLTILDLLQLLSCGISFFYQKNIIIS